MVRGEMSVVYTCTCGWVGVSVCGRGVEVRKSGWLGGGGGGWRVNINYDKHYHRSATSTPLSAYGPAARAAITCVNGGSPSPCLLHNGTCPVKPE